jgi:hypothetical protein
MEIIEAATIYGVEMETGRVVFCTRIEDRIENGLLQTNINRKLYKKESPM